MYTENKTPRRAARGAVSAFEDSDADKNNAPASKRILAEANRVIDTFPSIMTRKSKRQAESKVLRLFLAALAAGREGVV